MKATHAVFAITVLALLTIVNLAGGTVLLSGQNSDGRSMMSTTDGTLLFAKGPKTPPPPPPEPDHGPTLPPDPWEPI